MKSISILRAALVGAFMIGGTALAFARADDLPRGVAVKIWAAASATCYGGEPSELDLDATFLPSTPDGTDGTYSTGTSVGTPGVMKTRRSDVRLEPGKSYKLFVDAITVSSLSVNVVPPPGYQMEINGMIRTRFYTTVTRGFSDSLTLRVLPAIPDLAGRAGEASSITSDKIHWEVALGSLQNGTSAGTLAVVDAGTSADWSSLFTPAALQYESQSSEVYVYRESGLIRQIIANQAVVDVVTVSSNSYELRFYNPAQLETATSYPRTFDGDPYVTYRIEQVDTGTSLKITSLTRDVTDYTVTNTAVVRTAVTTLTRTGSWPAFQWDLRDWTTSGQDALEQESRSWGGTTSARTETVDVLVPGASSSATHVANSYALKAWGEELTSSTVGTSNSTQSSYDYYEDSTQPGYARLKDVTSNTGAWQAFDYYDSSTDDSLTAVQKYVYQPFHDAPSTPTFDENQGQSTYFEYAFDPFGTRTRPTLIQTKTKGNITGKAVIAYTEDTFWQGNNGYNMVTATRDDQTDSSGATLRTLTKYFREDTYDALYRSQPHSIQQPNDVMQSYVYQHGTWDGTTFTPSGDGGSDTGTASRVAVITGSTSTGAKCTTWAGYDLDAVYLVDGKSTLVATIRDSRAQVARTETYAWSNSVWNLVSSTDYTYDNAGQLLTRVASNGSTYSAQYSGDQRTSETDETGITISYTYDVADRIDTAVQAGSTAISALTTKYSYDAAGHVLQKVIGSGQTETLVSSATYDDAGRTLTSSVPGPNGPLTTQYAYDPVNRTTTTTLPNGATQIDTAYPDGSPISTTGTAIVPQYATTDVLTDGTRYSRVNIGNSTSPRQKEGWTDWLGRPIKTSRPGFASQPAVVEQPSYNSAGLLSSKSLTDSHGNALLASTLYSYDALGQPVRSGLNLAGTGTLDLSTDRVADSDQYFEYRDNAWWMTKVTTVYPYASDSTPFVTSTTRVRLTGFPSGVQSESIAIDADQNTVDQTVTVDRANQTVTTTTTTTGLTNPETKVAENGFVTSITRPDGLQYTTGYDALHRQSTVTVPRIGTSTTFYKSGSASVSIVRDAAGVNVATYTYDDAGEVIAVADANGKVRRMDYNTRGQVVHQWGDTVYPTETVYDTYGQRTELHTYQSGTFNGLVWPGGTPTSVTQWTYDEPSGLLASKTDATGHIVSYSYNGRGQSASRTWARGVITTYSYDDQTGELLSQSYSDNTPTVSYTYTRSGQLNTVTDLTGERDFVYNHANPLQLDSIALSDYYGGRLLTRQYDGIHRPNGFSVGTVAAPSSDLAQTYTYDSNGRFDHVDAASSGDDTRTFGYGYNAGGLISSLSIPGSAFLVSRTYEPNRDLLTAIDSQWCDTSQPLTSQPSTASRTRFEYTYNALGQRVTSKQVVAGANAAFADLGGSTYYRTGYNDRGEVTDSADYAGEDATRTDTPQLSGRHFAYGYDAIGNRVSASRTGNAGTADAYTANALNQYTQRTNAYVHAAGTVSTATTSVNTSGGGLAWVSGRQGRYWASDALRDSGSAAAAMPLTVTATIAGGGTNGADSVRVDSSHTAFVPAQTQVFTYDADGNLTSDGLWTYTYDGENRLISMTSTGLTGFPNQLLDFQYDYLGRRVQKKAANWDGSQYNLATARRYLYDGNNLVAEYDAPGGTSCGSLLKSYAWALDLAGSLSATGGVGALIQITDHASRTSYFPTYDGNGNVAALLRASDGVVTAKYEYSPFGDLLRAEGDQAKANPFRFSTKFTDDETGLVYYGARFYSPSLGRFINRDPIEEAGGINLYGFCANDGINGLDRLGHSWLSKFWNRTFGSLGRHIAQNWDHGRGYVELTVAIVASIFVGYEVAMMAEQAIVDSAAASAVAAGGDTLVVSQAVMGAAAINSASTAILAGAAGGAAAGAVGSGMMTAMQGRNLGQIMKASLQGAVSGAIMGGVDGYYGTSMPFSRIPVTALAGGAASQLSGGKFRRGFEIGGVQGVAMYGWGLMRDFTDQVGRNAAINDQAQNRWHWDSSGLLRTDGTITAEDMPSAFGATADRLAAPITKFLDAGGMGSQGVMGAHWYDSAPGWLGGGMDGPIARFINAVSKVHDVWEGWDYDVAKGSWYSRGSAFNGLYDIIGMAGMPPSGMYTAFALNPASTTTIEHKNP